jgi:hypothetical protein
MKPRAPATVAVAPPSSGPALDPGRRHVEHVVGDRRAGGAEKPGALEHLEGPHQVGVVDGREPRPPVAHDGDPRGLAFGHHLERDRAGVADGVAGEAAALGPHDVALPALDDGADVVDDVGPPVVRRAAVPAIACRLACRRAARHGAHRWHPLPWRGRAGRAEDAHDVISSSTMSRLPDFP